MKSVELTDLALVRAQQLFANPQGAEDMTRLQPWRDDVDIEISIERIRRGTNRSPERTRQN
jgi:hypothetical protein